jgi:hypothetical protein
VCARATCWARSSIPAFFQKCSKVIAPPIDSNQIRRGPVALVVDVEDRRLHRRQRCFGAVCARRSCDILGSAVDTGVFSKMFKSNSTSY